MRIAIQGCCHGELNTLYNTLLHIQSQESIKIDLLLICGDFQSIRNKSDLNSLACPIKYRKLGDFYDYYKGVKTAPIPTIFIGGNHESSNYLWELFHGGYVAPNIWFMGHSGVVRVGNLRIGGCSGIYKYHDFDRGYFERFPLSDSDARSIYHTRKYHINRLSMIQRPLDIFLSHDWPKNIELYGDLDHLLKVKPFLLEDIQNRRLGSPPLETLLKKLQPRFWFSAHLHVKYPAIYQHTPLQSGIGQNPDEILIDDDSDDSDGVVEPRQSSLPSQPSQSQQTQQEQEIKYTKFLALDKILPRREFLQIIQVDGEYESIRFDEEWLAIVKATNEFLSFEKTLRIPSQEELQLKYSQSLDWVQSRISKDPNILIPPPFTLTAPSDANDDTPFKRMSFFPLQTVYNNGIVYTNPQTAHLSELLEIQNYFVFEN